MQPTVTVRPLTEHDAAAFLALRRRALTTNPDEFMASLADEDELSLDKVRQRLAHATVATGEIIFGAFAPGLIGAVALTRDLRAKHRHRAELHEMYVAPELRGRGVGKMLVRQAVAVARTIPGLEVVHGDVVAHNQAAMGLYEQFGFVQAWVYERWLKCGDRYFDGRHIVLDLAKGRA
jgi:ribosomal protein S18 acetylase RimI-like enzyme